MYSKHTALDYKGKTLVKSGGILEQLPYVLFAP